MTTPIITNTMVQTKIVDPQTGNMDWQWVKWFQQMQATLNNAIALFAPLASPTFTGTVKQPAPSVLTAATTATSANAGAASALPATPAGYLEMSINGTVYKVPYYGL